MGPLVKDKRGFIMLHQDYMHVMAAFGCVKTRIAEKSLNDVLEQILQTAWTTLTEEGQRVHEDSDEDLFDSISEERDRRRQIRQGGLH